MPDAALVVSVSANIVLALTAGIQSIMAYRAKQEQSTNAALKEENDSLRRQLGDHRDGHVKLEAKEAERARLLEERFKAGHRAWEQQQLAQGQAMQRGLDSAHSVVRAALAAAEIAQAKYLAKIDQMINVAKDLSSHDLKMSRSALDEILDTDDSERLQKAMIEHGRSLNILVMLKPLRQAAESGMEFCGRMTLLEAEVINTGVVDSAKSIQHAIRDFLDARPLYTQQDELGETFEIRITIADIERHWEMWSELGRKRRAAEGST